MARIDGVEVADTQGYVEKILTAQAKTWGAPLLNHVVYARRPALFRAVRGMWTGLDSDGLLEPAILGLLNRRVARLNGCVF